MSDQAAIDDLQSNDIGAQMINMEQGDTLQTLQNKIVLNEEEQLDSVQNKNDLNPNENVQNTEVKTQISSDDTKQSSEGSSKTDNFTQTIIDKLLCVFGFIRPYFQVTFNDIKTRIIQSFIPLNNLFFNTANDKPDLYGPFWIYTTLIYVMAAGGALSYYFTDNKNNYFQSFVPVAGSILYSFGFGFPLVLWLCFKFFKINMKYMTLICLYGYSLTCFVPVLIICAFGFNWLQWLVLTYAILNSTAFVLINLWNTIKGQEDKTKYTILGIISANQFIFYLTLKLYFFGAPPTPTSSSSTQNNNPAENK